MTRRPSRLLAKVDRAVCKVVGHCPSGMPFQRYVTCIRCKAILR